MYEGFSLRFSTLTSLLVPLSLLSNFASASPSCQTAEILFGPIRFDILPANDYETAIIRHVSFDTIGRNYGMILGEITVDRGGFALRNINHETIALISPDLVVDTLENGCTADSRIEIVKIREGIYAVLVENSLMGTIEGRFPDNGFGVR